ncbi:MAG: hypothetical protein ND807_00750 [Vicinamibacterales bacterium]|nr:hypothetical protein [Vicinamibacterales bacterium]
MHMRWRLAIVVLAGLALAVVSTQRADRQWLAGDSHIHSQWSPGYDETKSPPEPIVAGDARYPTPTNARKAREFGLAWMVTTDHGGPNHAKFNLTRAYAELQTSRQLEPGVLQFYGMELNMPGMDHHTLIIPNSSEESSVLYEIEHQFDSKEAWPADPSRNSEAQRQRALEHMKALPRLPLLFANHPSRSAKGIGQYGLDEPREFRDNNDLAPEVYHGMEGAPGHQAGGLAPDGGPKVGADGRPLGFRGAYGNPGAYTIGGFDQMTAIVGGLWDSLLGEGRRFWILATSDSHVNYAESVRPGSDFWPGQYQKTYVHAVRSYDGVLDGLRSGRIFAVSGDLISLLDIEAASGKQTAGIGGTLTAARGQDVRLTVRFRDPETTNAHGDNPRVARVDVIVGDVGGAVPDRTLDKNPTAHVVSRFTAKDWKRDADIYTFSTTLPRVDRNVYLRLRGTSTQDLEPAMDAPGENPWPDLWFYSNPIFVEISGAGRD